MASQQGFGLLPPGAAPFGPQPASPRGLYRSFGMPESLLRIHFPNKNNPKTSKPWFWYIPLQQPFYFSFLFTTWVRLPDFTIIKILQIDPRQPEPAPKVGANSLEQAITSGNPDATWGRFNFQNPFFWKSIQRTPTNNKSGPVAKPEFDLIKGLETTRPGQPPIGTIIKSAVKLWETDWNGEAAAYNAIAGGVGANGFHYGGQPHLFSVPLPDGPPTTISKFNSQLSSFAAYLGPVPPSAFFNINTNTTQAYAFNYRVAQLDDTKWNMSVFPPLLASGIGNGRPSAHTLDYSGFGATDFPVSGPVLV